MQGLKRFQWILMIILSLLLCNVAGAQAWKQELTEQLSNELPTALTGIVVRDANTGAVLFQWNAFQAFTPASNEKLFTAAAILSDLGPDYRYKTVLSFNPKNLHGHTLRGNLYIKFSGDPSFKSKDLKKILAHVSYLGIKKIQGNLVLDNSRFQAPDHAPGWTYDSLHYAFSAPINTIIINQNQVAVKFEPSKTIGQPVKIIPGRYIKFVGLDSHINTVTYQQAMKNCSLNLNVDRRNTIHLGGCWPSGSSGWQSFAIFNPALYAERMIRYYLKTAGVRLTGQVTTGLAPHSAKSVYTHRSKDLKYLLRKMLKDSDNIYAESFAKTLGSVYTGHGTFLEGVNAIEAILGKLTDIDFKQTDIYDGSGQSRYDLVTPNQISRLLYMVYKNRGLKKYFIKALPISGVDGTLRWRMTSSDLKGKVHAKTGTMSGVSALSGYLTTQSDKHLIFSIMINHVVDSTRTAQHLENEVCETLYQV